MNNIFYFILILLVVILFVILIPLIYICKPYKKKYSKKDYFTNYSKNEDDKIISFSLFGKLPLYNYGVLENSLIAGEIFPEYKVYIYYVNADTKIINELKKLKNVKLFEMKEDWGFGNSLWRFIPTLKMKPNDIVIVRDTDVIILNEEVDIISEWLDSGKALNVIRLNSGPVISAGSFAVKGDIFNEFTEQFLNYKPMGFYGEDQMFLSAYFYKKAIDTDNVYSNNMKGKEIVFGHTNIEGNREEDGEYEQFNGYWEKKYYIDDNETRGSNVEESLMSDWGISENLNLTSKYTNLISKIKEKKIDFSKKGRPEIEKRSRDKYFDTLKYLF